MRELVLVILVVLAAASTALTASAGNSVPPRLEEGKRLYTSKCARCHRFYDPAKYDDRAWNEWMNKMRKKTKLNDAQFATLANYLQSLGPERTPSPAMNKNKER